MIQRRRYRRRHRPIELERVSLRARLRIETLEGQLIATSAECVEIGLKGLRATAAQGIVPGTPVQLALKLPSGIPIEIGGRVSRCCTTLHLAPFGTPRGFEDDAMFEIEFDDCDSESLWPIAVMLTNRCSAVQRIEGAAKQRRLIGSDTQPA